MTVPAPSLLPATPAIPSSEVLMREQLLKQQKELLELQKQKIELELLQAQAAVAQQQRQIEKQAGTLPPAMVRFFMNIVYMNIDDNFSVFQTYSRKRQFQFLKVV